MSVDFSQITSRLGTGGGLVLASDVDALVTAGYTHILDLTDAEDDTSLLANHPDLTYLWNPAADDGQPKPPEWFGTSLTFALPMFPTPGTRLYAHCSAGVNRGPSTTYCIMRALGWSKRSALALLKRRRPQVRAIYRGDADRAIVALGFD